MAYDSTVPASGSSLGSTRAPILENFVQIESAFNVDHVDFNDLGQGKHAKVTMPEGAAPTTAADEAALYTKDTNGRPTLFYRQESDGTEIQLTKSDPIASDPGETFLPGGMGIKWGLVEITTPGSQTYTYASLGLSDFDSATYSCVATPTDRTRSVGVLSFTKSEIRLGINGNVGGFICFMVVGK